MTRRHSADPHDLRRLRERLGHTQAHVADLVGASPRTVRSWEGGERALPVAVLHLYALSVLLAREGRGDLLDVDEAMREASER